MEIIVEIGEKLGRLIRIRKGAGIGEGKPPPVESIKPESIKVLPKTDKDLAAVLDLAGIQLNKQVYLILREDYQEHKVGAAIGEHGEALLLLPASGFNQQWDKPKMRWAIGVSLKTWLQGKEEGFNPQLGGLSNVVFSYFARFSSSGEDPRDYNFDTLEERFKPIVKILFAIWEKFPPEKRTEVVRAIWRENLGESDLEKALEVVDTYCSPTPS